MTHISWREVPLLIRCVPAAAKMPWVRLRCLLFNCLPSCSFRICLKCTDEAMDEILYCYEMWQCNDQIHAIEVWNHCILNWIQIEMDIFCPCRSDVFVVVLLHVHVLFHFRFFPICSIYFWFSLTDFLCLVSSFTPPGLHSVHQSVTSTRCIYSWTGAFSFLWADVLLFVCFGVFFVTA